MSNTRLAKTISQWLWYFYCLPSNYVLDHLSYIWIDGTQLPLWSKFHGESTDLLYIFQIFPTHCNIKQLQWHISLKVWFIYSQMYAAVSCAEQAGQCSHHMACKCKQITKNGFFSCKNSFYVKHFRLLKQWFAKIWKI